MGELEIFPGQHIILRMTAGAGMLNPGIQYQICNALIRENGANDDTVNRRGMINIPSPRPAPKESDPS